jgi:hypothetical protein
MTLSPLATDQTMLKVLVDSHTQGSDDDFLIRIRTACEGTNLQG